MYAAVTGSARRVSFAVGQVLHWNAVILPVLLVGALVCGDAGAAPIAFVQVNYACPQTPQTNVSVPFNAAQGAGNLNVVIVGWNDAVAQVTSVTDTKGNVYQLAVGPTVRTSVATQSIYYAKNIAAAASGTNSVKVIFSSAADWPDIRILEYSGIDPVNPVDVTAKATGSNATANSGAVTTTNPADLLVAGNLVLSSTRAAGTGFTSRVVTVPDGDIAEDRVVSAIGSYSATAPLNGAAQWIMQMVAFRAAPTGPDTQPPTSPASLAATPTSTSQINLSWTASTDNVGVTGYLVEACTGVGCGSFAQIATTTGTTYSNTGLAAGTAYSYRVRATDAASNLSGYSNTASATTVALDTQPPTPPSNAVATAMSTSQINLSWTASTDNVGVTGYLVEACSGVACGNFAQIATTTGTTYSNTGLAAGTSYSYRVQATDARSNLSGYSNTASAITIPLDTQPPTAPSNAVATAMSTGQINLSWTASTDNVGVTGYLVEACSGVACGNFAQIATTTGTTYSNTGLTAGTSYSYRVLATDARNNLSGYSNTASATTLAPDTQPPTPPSNAVAAATSTSQISLSWAASTDNVGVTGYLVEACSGAACGNFAQVATTTGTTYNNTGLTGATSYSYRVRATDAASNLSDYSNPTSATTFAPDTQPPTPPSNLTATANSSSQITLGWTAATDDVGVTSYFVERCQGTGCSTFSAVGSTTATAFVNTALSPATSYGYRVRATDAAGNLGDYSNIAAATTTGAPALATPSYVQGNYAVPQSAKSVVTVPFTLPQAGGDLNVVVVGWAFSTGQVTSVADSAGNVYALATGPLSLSGGLLTQAIYYAKNIRAQTPGNVVTVRFASAVDYPDIRILEYHGIDPVSPLDAAVGATGTGTSSNSGPLVTTNNSDLLFASNIVQTHTAGAGSGFTSRLLTDPDGDIAEDRILTAAGSYSGTAPLDVAGGWIMQAAAFKAGPRDTTAPVVTVTAPVTGVTLTGTVTVNVDASDAAAVANVQLLVDGAVVGLPVTASPYTFSLKTAKFANGAHSIGATAVDLDQNVGTAAPVSVFFSNANPGNPAQDGLWSDKVALPIVPVNEALLPDGKVLMWDGQYAGADARVWDTTRNTVISVPAPENIFCSGQEQLADGRILVIGGSIGAHIGLKSAMAYNPGTQSWTVLHDMAYPRWYPTVTALPDGRMIVMSGEDYCPECYVPIHEIYNPTTNSWTQLSSSPFTFAYYPHIYVLPDGRVAVPAVAEDPIVSQVLNLATGTWSAVGGPVVDGGSSAMYAPAKFIKTGTSVDPDDIVRPSAATAYVLDMAQPSATWRPVAPMNYPRTYHTMTLLPDGNVLVTGGGPTTAATAVAQAILPAEMWSPVTETWRKLAPMAAPRLYHSEALLMPDGRVMVSGGGRFNGLDEPTDQLSAEFFSPPYLFKGPRPVIGSAPQTLQYGQPFTVGTPDASRIGSVQLMRFGNVTHAFNSGQRIVSLAFSAAGGSLTVSAPANANLAPPGYYMLFIVDTLGVPSVAAVVHF